MTDTTHMLRAALDAVATASHLTRAVQTSRDDVAGHMKDDRSPVTVADYAAQAIVSVLLAEHLPAGECLIVGEEAADDLRGDQGDLIRKAVVEVVRTVRHGLSEDAVLDAIDAGGHDGRAQAYWTLDPVDGTKGFLRGQQYAIALGRIERGTVVLGVLGCPNLPVDVAQSPANADPHGDGSLYAAVKGEGAWEYANSDPASDPMRIQCRAWSPDRPVRTCASVEKAHSNRSLTDELLEHVGAGAEPVRLDSQAKYAVLGRGQADAYLRLPTQADYTEKIWDHAAGSLVASEAGAVVTDVDGQTLDFSHGPLLQANRGVIAAARGLHERLVDGLAEVMDKANAK